MKKDIKLSELLHALEWLGIEEAADIEKTPIQSISIDHSWVLVTTLALDENGQRWAGPNDEVATNVHAYKIENDL